MGGMRAQPMTQTRRRLRAAAAELGRDGVLADPTDAQIVEATRELVYGPGRLLPIPVGVEPQIVRAWEKGNREWEES